MRRSLGITLIAAIASFSAQSSAQGAFVPDVVTTPLGAFTPIVPGSKDASGTRTFGVLQRMAFYENKKSMGLGFVMQRGALRSTVEVGTRVWRGGSRGGAAMGGIDLQLALAERTVGASTKFLLAVNPALGFGKSNEDGGYRSTAVGISVPMTASIYVGDSTRIIPFVSPGVSMTRLSSNGQADAASHGMVAIGVTMAAVEVPVQLTASMRKLFIRDAAPVFGFALSVSR